MNITYIIKSDIIANGKWGEHKTYTKKKSLDRKRHPCEEVIPVLITKGVDTEKWRAHTHTHTHTQSGVHKNVDLPAFSNGSIRDVTLSIKLTVMAAKT